MTCPDCERYKQSAAMWRNKAYELNGTPLPWKPRIDQGPDYERGFIDGMQHQMQSSVDKAVNRMAQPEQEPSCAECGVNGGYALYCVACAEKFVGGYKENVPVHTSELLTQVSTDTQYAGNGTAGREADVRPTGFFFQMPPQRTWVGLTHSDIDQGLLRSNYAMKTAQAWRDGVYWAQAKLKEKNI